MPTIISSAINEQGGRTKRIRERVKYNERIPIYETKNPTNIKLPHMLLKTINEQLQVCFLNILAFFGKFISLRGSFCFLENFNL
jgi:hypothetical protein